MWTKKNIFSRKRGTKRSRGSKKHESHENKQKSSKIKFTECQNNADFFNQKFCRKKLAFFTRYFSKGVLDTKRPDLCNFTRYGSTKDIETKKISCWTMSVMISSCMLNNPKRSIFDIILQTFLCVKLRLHRQLQLVRRDFDKQAMLAIA